jgi:hypothetical protein
MSDASTTVSTVAADVSEVAGIAAPIAALVPGYGLLAATVLNIVQVLAKNAPAEFAIIQKAFTSADPAQTDYYSLIAEIEALQIDP